MTDQELRLACVSHAIHRHDGEDAETIIAEAQKLYDFCNKAQTPDRQLSNDFMVSP